MADPSRIQESKTTTAKEVTFREELEQHFDKAPGSSVEKLQNFAKYVPRQNLARFLSKYELFKQVLDVHGSIVECGVYLGGGLMTFAQLSAILEPVNHTRHIIGFDTFGGFAGMTEIDKKGGSQHAEDGGMAAECFEELRECIKLYDQNRFLNHLEKVELVEGDIRKTAPAFLKDRPETVISLLYLDLDLYEPTKAALKAFLPRMPKGAIIAFDELNAANWPGETQAVLEELGLGKLRIKRFPFDTFISYAVLE